MNLVDISLELMLLVLKILLQFGFLHLFMRFQEIVELKVLEGTSRLEDIHKALALPFMQDCVRL